jgi:putative membrane protein
MPYSKFDPDQMILRDHLAYDRTVLANERTLLSYLRTSIALFASGGTLLKLLPEEPMMVKLGIVLLSLGLVAVVVGIIRFTQVKKRIGVAYDKLEELEEGNDN